MCSVLEILQGWSFHLHETFWVKGRPFLFKVIGQTSTSFHSIGYILRMGNFLLTLLKHLLISTPCKQKTYRMLLIIYGNKLNVRVSCQCGTLEWMNICNITTRSREVVSMIQTLIIKE